MKQLTQQLKSGQMEIIDVPFPLLGDEQILVRNHYSVISAGTEGKTVSDARKGYLAKAKSRQKEVKQVVEMIKTTGIKSTYSFVMNKLDAPSSLGYSCAGEVIAVGSKVTGFKVGDWAACGGNSAHHADVVAVPLHLAVKVPKEVSLKEAAFTTLGAIAIQGIRQAELKLGESCLIIGMGLIGQLSAKILLSAGIKVFAVDINEAAVRQAQANGIQNCYHREQAGIEELIQEFSGGFGVDSVIITAATSSHDPVNFAGEVVRKKGKIIIVGAVPTGFNRTNFYKKELDVRMSMSYGPGRGDLSYEEKGQDYPYAYVRWTENRNMEAFVSLLASEKIQISPLISHVFDLVDAKKAYDLILDNKESYNGILIRYENGIPDSKIVYKKNTGTKPVGNRIGLIGAGNYAQGILLPKMSQYFQFGGLVTSKGNMSHYVAKKYGFTYASDQYDDLLNDPSISAIFITTRHDSHAKYVMEALEKGKNVFVEKPLALTESDLEKVKNCYEKHSDLHLIVGFNRRFSPAIQEIKKLFLPEQMKCISIRVNAGKTADDHWVNHPEIGGGRIIGEACHFIDLAMYLADSPVQSISAEALDHAHGMISSVAITMGFKNGSIASVSYFSNGNKAVQKEWIEVFSGGTVVQINDFKSMSIFGKTEKQIKFKGQDKGHQQEIHLFQESLLKGLPPIIPFEEAFQSSLLTFKVLESIRGQRKIVFPDK